MNPHPSPLPGRGEMLFVLLYKGFDDFAKTLYSCNVYKKL